MKTFMLTLSVVPILACQANEMGSGSETEATGSGEAETEATSSGSELTTATTATTDATTGSTTGAATHGETGTDGETDESTAVEPVCGNGIVEAGEACDDGNLAGDGPCVHGCNANVCGDGYVYAGVEACDAGEQNGKYAGSCGEDCTTESIPSCGDGVLQEEYETCEAGETNGDGVSCNPEHCQWGDSRYIFVSSETLPGNLESEQIPENMTGLARADTLCQILAVAAGLPGSYYAWLSDNNNIPGYSDAAARIGGAQDGVDVAYVMPQGGVAVAHGWDGLVENGPAVAITRTETGMMLDVTPVRVWSNTDSDGTSLGESACDNWSSMIGFGWTGSTTTGTTWTDVGLFACTNVDVHLYCIQGMEK